MTLTDPALILALGSAAASSAAVLVFLRALPGATSTWRRITALGAVVLLVMALAAYVQWLGTAESIYLLVLVLTIALTALPFIRAGLVRLEQ